MRRNGAALADTWDPGLSSGVRPCAPRETPGHAGRYLTGPVIGRGGMGEVRSCNDRSIGREVAMKTLHASAGGSETRAARFVREVRLQGRLEHPAIVPVYDLGTTDDGQPFFTMKRVRGETLADVIAALRDGEAACSPRKVLTAFVTVCLAIDYAHRAGVVHRDLKPQNIMLGRFGEVHVIDWGCAATVEQLRGEEVRGALDLHGLVHGARATGDGEVIGTPGYLAPEQARGAQVGTPADVYALGAILFELLTLEPLHDAPTALGLLVSAIQGVDGRPSRRTPERCIAEALDDLAASALATDAAERPSARELAEGVERYLDGELQRAQSRDWAGHHAERASRAADEAISGRDEGLRAIALREAGRALALDPENATAQATLERLLLAPPEVAPAAAREAIAATERELARAAVRWLATRMAVWMPFVAFAIALGVRDALGAAVALGTIGALAVTVGVALVKGWTGRGTRWTLVALTSLATATFGGLFGPFVLVPAFAATIATGFAVHYGRTDRILAAVLGASAVALPYLLELAGVIPASMTITTDAITLHPRLVVFSTSLTPVFLVLTNVLPVIVNVVITGRQRDALDDARRRLSLRAWQLEQLVPPAVSAP